MCDFLSTQITKNVDLKCQKWYDVIRKAVLLLMTNIGERIKKRRLELGMSQDELAERMGYKSRSTITKIEKGINDVVQSNIVKFSEALNTSIAYLMGWENDEELSQKIDVTTDILVRMETDKDFSDLVQILYKMDSEKIKALKVMLD